MTTTAADTRTATETAMLETYALRLAALGPDEFTADRLGAESDALHAAFHDHTGHRRLPEPTGTRTRRWSRTSPYARGTARRDWQRWCFLVRQARHTGELVLLVAAAEVDHAERIAGYATSGDALAAEDARALVEQFGWDQGHAMCAVGHHWTDCPHDTSHRADPFTVAPWDR